MLHIGEFSALTGLTVKALRHYDEQGLLGPARVDETSGHRFYAPRQIRDALTILALREADVPLPLIARVLGSPGDVGALEEQRDRVLRERRRHDAAFDAVLQAFDAPAGEIVLARREEPEQAFLGYPLAADPHAGVAEDGDTREGDTRSEDARDDDASDPFARAGVDVSDSHWVSTRVRDQETHDVTLCWPVPEAAAPDDLPGFISGVLPARTELFVTRGTDAAGLQDLGWYAEALTRLVEALAAEQRPHRDGFLMRYQVSPTGADSWDIDLSVVL
ncbi:predicted transcriptional regulator [Microbacterium testaceum StLB037]|uniref:Predicted transcriptional regulator n=1 Tax=Microbacterium testaceum (strain StLB037) TaxID=979556 RepID=E8NAC1_MICTS|nr:MerR family transcriptional regulator [Microbacterium testaceum]BAJ73355.1 predicted transcriptional regulator [Microbacterium testaceum StLB037]